ncbi:MAG: hypothetical protein AAF959_04625 [Cyanobacteria bacterium P01_D01_bin.56]
MESLSYIGQKNVYIPREPMTVPQMNFGRRVQATVPREPIQGKVHIYKDKSGQEYQIKKAVASIYCDPETDEVAITFLMKDAEGKIIPLLLWRDNDEGYYWDLLLGWPENEIDLNVVVNPVPHDNNVETFAVHPIIEPVNEIADQYKLPRIYGKIAKPLHYFIFNQRLKHIVREDRIIWDYFSYAQKLKELMTRGNKSAVELLSFAQGMIEIDKNFIQWAITPSFAHIGPIYRGSNLY